MSPTTPSTDLVEFETEKGAVKLSRQIVRQYFCSGASDTEIDVFMKLCQYQNLNPFLRECHLIKYGNNPASMVVGWHVFLKRAEKNPNFDGYDVEVFTSNDVPYRGRPGEDIAYCTAKIYRKDRAHPTVVTVLFSEYCVLNNQGKPAAAWAKIPATMIRKVGLEQGLRETFTADFVGMYGAAELGLPEPTKDDEVITVTPVAGEEPEEPDDLPVATAVGPAVGFSPSPLKPQPPAPFAVVKFLTDLYGADYRAHTAKYFGVPLYGAQEMKVFMTANPDKWTDGVRVLQEDRARGKA